MRSNSQIPLDRKEIWIGKVEVRNLVGATFLADAKGAFVNMVTWAASTQEFRNNVELVLRELGLYVPEVENPEPVSIRRKSAELDDDIEDMISRAEHNPNAIIYGTFHQYKRDDA
jgi:hypothetical protein